MFDDKPGWSLAVVDINWHDPDGIQNVMRMVVPRAALPDETEEAFQEYVRKETVLHFKTNTGLVFDSADVMWVGNTPVCFHVMANECAKKPERELMQFCYLDRSDLDVGEVAIPWSLHGQIPHCDKHSHKEKEHDQKVVASALNHIEDFLGGFRGR